MPLLISLLNAVLTRVGSSAALATILRLIQQSNRYWGRAGYIEKRIAEWFVVTLASAGEVYDEFYQRVLDYFSNMMGSVMDELSKEEFMRVGGEAAAKEINKQLLKRYGLESPITNVMSETLVEELGIWFAEITNEKLSVLMNKDVELVSTFFPIENIAPEIDSFLADELNLRMGTNIDSVLFNDNIVAEIQRAVVSRLETEIISQVAHAKGVAIEQITAKSGITLDDKADLIRTYNDVMDTVLSSLNFFNLIGVNTSLVSTYQRNKIRIHNRARQREYRRMHKEVRHWEVRN